MRAVIYITADYYHYNDNFYLLLSAYDLKPLRTSNVNRPINTLYCPVFARQPSLHMDLISIQFLIHRGLK